MSPPWLDWPPTRALAAAFSAHPGSFRFVGGAVRDALLSRAAQDVDAATSLAPERVMALLEKAGIRAIPTGLAHGTVTALIEGRPFEITTLRRDVACDGRHAEVAFTDDWREDAARRDFTMNALYLSPEGELFDYFGGAADAVAGRVRFIGDPGARIAEDYLRILRFFRFHAHFGTGAPDAAALAACAALSSQIAQLSGERVRHELFKLLDAPRASETLEIMRAAGILPPTLGFSVDGCDIFARLENVERLASLLPPPLVKLAGFALAASSVTVAEAAAILAERLRLSGRERKTLPIVLQHYADFSPDLDEARQKRLLRRLGADHFRWAAMLRWAEGSESIEKNHPYHAMLALPAAWRPPAFPVGGDDLLALGVAPGKALGELLRTLEERWEASDYAPTREELLAGIKRGM